MCVPVSVVNQSVINIVTFIYNAICVYATFTITLRFILNLTHCGTWVLIQDRQVVFSVDVKIYKF